MKMKFYCETCDLKLQSENEWGTHLMSRNHQQNRFAERLCCLKAHNPRTGLVFFSLTRQFYPGEFLVRMESINSEIWQTLRDFYVVGSDGKCFILEFWMKEEAQLILDSYSASVYNDWTLVCKKLTQLTQDHWHGMIEDMDDNLEWFRLRSNKSKVEVAEIDSTDESEGPFKHMADSIPPTPGYETNTTDFYDWGYNRNGGGFNFGSQSQNECLSTLPRPPSSVFLLADVKDGICSELKKFIPLPSPAHELEANFPKSKFGPALSPKTLENVLSLVHDDKVKVEQ